MVVIFFFIKIPLTFTCNSINFLLTLIISSFSKLISFCFLVIPGICVIFIIRLAPDSLVGFSLCIFLSLLAFFIYLVLYSLVGFNFSISFCSLAHFFFNFAFISFSAWLPISLSASSRAWSLASWLASAPFF